METGLVDQVIDFIKRVRGEHSQEEFSRLLGRDYSRRRISGYERGELAVPATYLVHVAQVTESSLDEVFLHVRPTTDVIQSMIGQLDMRGREQLRAWLQGYLASMPV